MSNIQISRNLFELLCAYFFDDDLYLVYEIRRQLGDKLEKMYYRDLFSRYKAASGSDREQFRRAYLDSRGVPGSFRTSDEWHDEQPPD